MTIIFTDGSARGNPGPGGWGAIVLTEDTAQELGGREDHTTNNRMELMAAISALEASHGDKEVTLYTDSAYVVNGITRWVKGWQVNKWMTSQKEEVLNKDLWKKLISATEHRTVDWKLIKGHSGTKGNERCDVIATSFADGNSPVLYNGSRSRYGIDVSIVPRNSDGKSSKSKTKAYSYVSSIDGVVQIHKTWEECKARVSGVSGAKFKKSTSPENEEEIAREFEGG
jgi:ribonuclease HI